jgi:hypothetical protein
MVTGHLASSFLSCRSFLFLLQQIPLVFLYVRRLQRPEFLHSPLALPISSMRDDTVFHMLAYGLSLFSPLITTPNRPGLSRRTADEMTRLCPRLRPLRHQERGFLRSRLNHQRYRLNLGSPLLRLRPLPLRTPTVTREGRLRHIVKLSSSFNQIPISSIVIVNCNGCSGYWLQHLVLLARLFQPRVPFAANIIAPRSRDASTSTPIACLPVLTPPLQYVGRVSVGIRPTTQL